jgi:hypothetical protein
MKSHLDIGCVAFDPKTPVVDKSAFYNGADWKEFYGEVQEELPPKMPETKLQDVHTQVLSFMFRMLQSFGTVKDRIQWRRLLLEVRWLLCRFVKS